jgi:hypothetical protein
MCQKHPHILARIALVLGLAVGLPLTAAATCAPSNRVTPAPSSTAASAAAVCDQPVPTSAATTFKYITVADVQSIVGPCYYLIHDTQEWAIFHSVERDQPDQLKRLDIQITVRTGEAAHDSWARVKDDPNYDRVNGKFANVDIRSAQGLIGNISACVCNNGDRVGAFLSVDLGYHGTVLTPEQNAYYRVGVGGEDSLMLKLVGKFAPELRKIMGIE